MARRQNLLVQVPQSFREMPRWWGDVAGHQWLDRLPRLVADQCRTWGLQLDGAVRHGSNALVVPVRRGAEELVVRMSPPGDDVGQEASALQFWNGQGTVKLICSSTWAPQRCCLSGLTPLDHSPLSRSTRQYP